MTVAGRIGDQRSASRRSGVSSDMGHRVAGTDGLSDEALLTALAVGDPDVGAVYVRRFERRIYGLALSMVADATVAEDIAQEALLRGWCHAAVFDPRRASVATWLLAITRNLAIDFLRLRRAVPTDPGAFLLLDLPATDKGPDDSALDTDAAAQLLRAIRCLPGDQRRALVLAAFYGQTAQQISEAEGIPLGTAKTRIRAATGKLLSALVGSEIRP